MLSQFVQSGLNCTDSPSVALATSEKVVTMSTHTSSMFSAVPVNVAHPQSVAIVVFHLEILQSKGDCSDICIVY